jgi:hypothetical protein
MSPIWIGAVFTVGAIIFNAGVVYALVSQVRNDVNGIGKNVRSNEEYAQDDRVANAATLMLICPEVRRAELAGLLIGARRR